MKKESKVTVEASNPSVGITVLEPEKKRSKATVVSSNSSEGTIAHIKQNLRESQSS